MYSVASTLDSFVQPSVSLAVFLALALAFLSRHAPWLRRMQLHAFHPFRSLCELTLHVRGSRSAMSSTAVSVLRGRSHPFRRNGWTCTVRAIAVRFRRARVSPSSRSSFPSLAARTLTSRCSGCGTKHDAHAPSRRRTRSVRRSRRFPRRFFSRSFAGASAPFPLASFVHRAPRAPRLRPRSCRTIATRVLRIRSKARWDRSQVQFDVNGDENKQGGSDGEEGKASMKGRDGIEIRWRCR